MTTLAVQFSNVEKHYPHFKLDVGQLELPRGHIMGFVGPNGAGKSTTMRILMGLVHQDRGDVYVLGKPMPAAQAAVKQDVGYVSEDMRLYSRMTLAWHMNFIQSIYPGWDSSYAQALLRRFDLKPQQKIKELSHGQQVKASLLLALSRRPHLLVLDEPTAGLDPVARHEVIAEIMEVLTNEDRTVLFSSHNTLEIEQISDQITFIDRGQIIDSSDKETFLEQWRRLRLEAPPDIDLPLLPGVAHWQRNGRQVIVTANKYDAMMTKVYQQAGATVHGVETMSLEEIFVANVHKNRKEKTA